MRKTQADVKDRIAKNIGFSRTLTVDNEGPKHTLVFTLLAPFPKAASSSPGAEISVFYHSSEDFQEEQVRVRMGIPIVPLGRVVRDVHLFQTLPSCPFSFLFAHCIDADDSHHGEESFFLFHFVVRSSSSILSR